MFLTVLVVFVVASIAAELMLLRQFPMLQRLVGRYRSLGIILSVGLSWVLGQLFAATGALVLIGSIASSVAVQPLHAIYGRWLSVADEVKGTLKSIRAAVASARRAVVSIYTGLHDLRRHLQGPK